jgi:surface polysaccharide O-acyltransferase-like enzyme
VGRIGIILLRTGIVITLIGYFKSFSNSNRVDSSSVSYLGVGLVVVGVVLLVIFVMGFVPNKRKHP